MITRERLHIGKAVFYSWRLIVYSLVVSTVAFILQVSFHLQTVVVPLSVVAVMGTALAIILGFRNASAYERWWEARKLWGGIVNESRTLTRQVMTIVDPEKVSQELWDESASIVHRQIAWIYALKLQLRSHTSQEKWDAEVKPLLEEEEYNYIQTTANKVTQIMMMQGRAIKKINSRKTMDTYSYIQMDDTLTRLTDLQGGCERIKATPLPKPYDYYTLAFLYLFVTFLPFGFIHELQQHAHAAWVFPISVLVSWIFYQIYVLGKVLSVPFGNLHTDVPLDAICRVIEIDLRQVIKETNLPEYLQPKEGVLM